MIPYEKVKEMCLSIGLVETMNGGMKNRASEFHFFAMPHDAYVDDDIDPNLVTYYPAFGCNVYSPNNECLASWVVGEERLEKVLEKLGKEMRKYQKERKLNSIRKSCAEFET
jgi:hypothetical protein